MSDLAVGFDALAMVRDHVRATGHEIGCEPAAARFVARPGDTLLKAGLAAGLPLPYECASGTCGTCKARLLEGRVDSLWPDAPGLSERDRARGDRILCCQTVPLTPCRIQVNFGEPIAKPKPQEWRAVVIERAALTHNVIRLRLRVAEACPFLAGQFMLFKLPAGRRAYSISNPPDAGATLEFVVKRKLAGRGSDYLFDSLAVGDDLTLEGPYGHAHLRADSERPIVGIAGGSGLGPVWSVVQAALQCADERPVHLFFGVNEAADLFYDDEFRALALRHPRLRVERVLLRAGVGDPAECRIGTVSQVAIQQLDDLTGCDVYMAGPSAMIDAALRDTVLVGKAAADRVFFDRFY